MARGVEGGMSSAASANPSTPAIYELSIERLSRYPLYVALSRATDRVMLVV